jgi:peptidoglycan-N-acetylglucosamine deacetylase
MGPAAHRTATLAGSTMAASNDAQERERARRRAIDRQRQFRRRRLGAIVGAGIVLLLLVLLVTSAFGGDSGKKKRAEDQLKGLTAPPDSAGAAHGRGLRAIDGVLNYTPYVSRGTPNQKLVALTFDDGPGPLTPQFLRVLQDAHTPATFFVITQQLKTFGDATRQAVQQGFEIGDHTVDHQLLGTLSKADQAREIVDGSKQMVAAGLPVPRLFRPPGGSFDATTMGILRKQHMLMALWDVDTRDYTLPGTPSIVQTVLNTTRPGSIVLMHDGGGDRSQTLAALPQIIKGLRAKGFKLVTVPDLVFSDPPPRNQAKPTNAEAG